MTGVQTCALPILQLGQAGAYVLTKENEHKPTIMVGCDTRISGDMLANALMAGGIMNKQKEDRCEQSVGAGGISLCMPRMPKRVPVRGL